MQNGIRYIIRENKRPENRAELRLVVNAGSILEDEDQQGLAHFVEHMAFNGTRNFPKQDLVNYLESIGMRFGPDLNAYTSFDETVYMLQVPTDSALIVTQAFQILEDWASGILFEAEEIDKERGVVIEEWRLGQGAGARLRDKQFPILLKGSRYADRLPIGKKSRSRYIQARGREAVLSGLVPPGPDVRHCGGRLRNGLDRGVDSDPFRADSSGEPAQRADIASGTRARGNPVRDRHRDPEATRTNVYIYYKQPVREQDSAEAYRQNIVESLYNRMLNARLRELTKKPDAPFSVRLLEPGALYQDKRVLRAGRRRQRRRDSAGAGGRTHGSQAGAPARVYGVGTRTREN